MARRGKRLNGEVTVLVGHGARDPAWAAPLERIAERLRRGGARVELAYLEFLEPELGKALHALCRSGARDIRVVPVFPGTNERVLRDIAGRVAAARAAHGAARIELAPAVGQMPGIAEAIAIAIATRVTPDPKAGRE
jgi:sirohydrochlorin cobaltochelatase